MTKVIYVLLLMCITCVIGAAGAAQSSRKSHRVNKPHWDHEPRHGGIFFMAMDQHHHLEGVLQKPGTFRVYLYDSYTRPLAAAKVKQISALVRWGDEDHAPETALTPSKDGKTLEASLNELKLPATLTLLVRFPGSPPRSRPELFTFPFAKYSDSTPGSHRAK
ncbi:MAG: hypothetical protein HYX72_08315 [Acidobacteria bacterium]|nr:hypothetical protein [Acidobacteriota bacterium]